MTEELGAAEIDGDAGAKSPRRDTAELEKLKRESTMRIDEELENKKDYEPKVDAQAFKQLEKDERAILRRAR